MEHPRLSLATLATCFALVASACLYTGPSVFHQEGSWVACGASGIHDPDPNNGAANQVSGSMTAVRDGNCNGAKIPAQLKNWTRMYWQETVVSPLVACTPTYFYTSGPAQNEWLVTAGNEACKNGNLGWDGYYATASYHSAWFFGIERSTYPGYPQASPWLYVYCNC
jgi:hypothetical protein